MQAIFSPITSLPSPNFSFTNAMPRMTSVFFSTVTGTAAAVATTFTGFITAHIIPIAVGIGVAIAVFLLYKKVYAHHPAAAPAPAPAPSSAAAQKKVEEIIIVERAPTPPPAAPHIEITKNNEAASLSPPASPRFETIVHEGAATTSMPVTPRNDSTANNEAPTRSAPTTPRHKSAHGHRSSHRDGAKALEPTVSRRQKAIQRLKDSSLPKLDKCGSNQERLVAVDHRIVEIDGVLHFTLSEDVHAFKKNKHYKIVGWMLHDEGEKAYAILDLPTESSPQI